MKESTPIKILIVGDRPSTSADLRESLARLGHRRVPIVRGGEEAREACRRQCPDIILVLHATAEGDACEMARDLRERCGLPMILIGRLREESEIARVVEMGFEGFLPLPYSESHLRVLLQMVLAKHRRPSAAWGLDNITDSITDPFLILSTDWEITYLNRAAADSLGESRRELMGACFWDSFPPDVRDLCGDAFAEAMQVEERRDVMFSNPGSEQWYEAGLYPYHGALIVMLRDVTDRRLHEEQSSRVDKMEALGLLARGFAHEFNNLLTVVLGHVSMAQERVPPEADYHTDLNTAKEATIDAQGRVQQLLTFARGGEPIRQQVNLARLVHSTLERWPRRRGVRYRLDLDEHLPHTAADPDQLRRVLGNLLRNAEQAMPSEGGEVVLRVRHAEQGFVAIEVDDDGEGVPPKHLARLFEPYFTTRTGENVSGIGLTVCESIVRAHGGSIELFPLPSGGTRARCELVAAPAEGFDKAEESNRLEELEQDPEEETSRAQTRKIRSAVPEAKAVGSNGGEILILEDEAMIRGVIKMSLERAGHRVIETEDGAETVVRYREALEAGTPYDLVIFDLSIPGGMGGKEAMAAIRELHPEVLAIVSSGYSDDPVMARHEDYGFAAVLPKPYEPKDLNELVASLLAERQRG